MERKGPSGNDDEADLLASLGTSVQDSSAYESQVIREATSSNAPKLTGMGFPDLAALSSSYNSFTAESSSKKRKADDNEIQHMLTVLSSIRSSLQELESKPNTSESRQAQILRMKYQMLLTYLATYTDLSREDVGLNVAREKASEEQRKNYLLRMKGKEEASRSSTIATDYSHERKSKKSGSTTKKPSRNALQRLELIKQNGGIEEDGQVDILSTSKSASFGQQALASRQSSIENAKRKSTKISMMGMKRKLVEEKGETWIDPEDLYKRRLARLERRRARRFGKKSKTPHAESADSKNIITIDDSEALVSMEESKVEKDHVYCSICDTSIVVPDEYIKDSDSFLSLHMNECQVTKPSKRRSRRTTRAATKPICYKEDEDVAEYKKMSNRQRRKAVKGWVDDDCIGDIEESDDESLIQDSSIHQELQDLKETSEKKYSRKSAIDDYDEYDYEDRVDDWLENGISSMRDMAEKDDEDERPGLAHFSGGLEIPAWINDRLFGYQRTGLRWLWELHLQEAGGIIGDEMGLGKTVQVCSFLGAMASSRKLKSVLIIAPATMLSHWLSELKIWAPGLRRVLVHKSGESDGSNRTITRSLLLNLEKWLGKCRADRINEPIDEKDIEENGLDSFIGTGYVLLTTFDNIRRSTDIWISHKWSYCVMDEGQKIRNPDAEVTIACKRLRTPHRLLLSGTPIQNDLRELWSLFDFVFPGRLGTLPVFMSEFADPIKRGGYSNATPMQVQLAYRCALVLRDLINPYLLRRQKKDIKEVSRMPGKTEQVLFCKLSTRQRQMYEAYLRSDDVKNIIRGNGSTQTFKPIIMLRKICNHPDLICRPDGEYESFLRNGFVNENDIDDLSSDEEDFQVDENFEESSLIDRSGKLEVLAKILPLWKKQNHRVLIFSQWKKMLDIIQHFMNMQGWKFGRLDGNTNIGSRQKLVDAFNNDSSYFAMLCTTKTGGVGLNLTGANRIILYDPDWNPQNDAQARERAWRFGQKSAVTVYRLITAGTIEEKIYQRQIFKTALSNQILQDPRQRRLFSQKDLRDLFTLKADVDSVAKGGEGVTETGALTKGRGVVDIDIEDRKNSGDEKDQGGNKETLEEVLKSKGLAGIFDHDVVDTPYAKKSFTVREMEEQATKVADRAAKSLAKSSATTDVFTPTFTGSEETAPRRFGGISRAQERKKEERSYENHFGGAKSAGMNIGSGGVLSSSSLLQQVQRRRNDIATGGEHSASSNNHKEEDFAVTLMKRIRKFIKQFTEKCATGPSTSQILDEFKDVKESDAALFKSILKQVAVPSKGHWFLR